MKVKYPTAFNNEEWKYNFEERDVFYLDSILGVPITKEEKEQIRKQGFFEFDINDF